MGGAAAGAAPRGEMFPKERNKGKRKELSICRQVINSPCAGRVETASRFGAVSKNTEIF